MTARFRLVHFVPDPFSGMRVPVAALVQQGSSVRVVRAPHTAGPGCVGGLATWHNMQGLLRGLESVEQFDQLPFNLGPHAVLGGQLDVPEQVNDPLSWVTKFILPQRPLAADDMRESALPSPRRDSVGQLFFQTWRVEQFVERRFKGEKLGLEDEYAGSITHAVLGSGELMLMEPVLGLRSDVWSQLEDISKSFLAWEKLLERKRARRKPRFVAFMFSSPRATVREAKSFLGVAEAEVIDVEVPTERDRFVSDIRRIGLTNPIHAHLRS